MDPQSPTPSYVIPLKPTTRSGIPKVMGILAMIFSVIGLLSALLQTFGTYDDIHNRIIDSSELGSFGTWIPAYMVFATIIFGVHLTAGILSVRYSPRCTKWMNGYAVSAILLSLANITITATSYPHELRMSGGNVARISLDFLAVIWPIIVLSLMNLRTTKDATSEALQQKIPKASIA